MLKSRYPLYLANAPVETPKSLPVAEKYTGKIFAEVGLADAALIDRAIAAAVKAAPVMSALPTYTRREILLHAVSRFEARRAELVEVLCLEAGKPQRDAKIEVGRLIETFRLAAEEVSRFGGEVLPLDLSERVKGYRGQWKRFPIGPCSFITPFNFPLNLVAHKVAPAIAVGCPFVLKPASLTPISALIVGEILAETALPKGAFSVLPCPRDGAERFTTDPRLKLLSFTGSPAVGWDLKARAGKKKTILELGGNAACLVDADWDIDDAVARILIGGFTQSGQSCISVQRVFIHETHYAAFRDKFVVAVKGLKSGDPRHEDTVIGPMISEKEAKRLEKWIQEAVAAGGKLLVGGHRQGAMLEASVLEEVPETVSLCTEEAFGPVVTLAPFHDFDTALKEINASKFGLQAGIFTRDLYKAQTAWETLDVGGVIIGDVPAWRSDAMPYGGVKDSGLGREGVRFAMEDMSEIRMQVIRLIMRP